MEVAGVDGCKAGWLTVRVDATDRLRVRDISISRTFQDLLDSTADCAAVAIDIPIGLPDAAARQADVLARRAIGSRRSSVFPAPVRATLAASTYEEACSLSERASGRKLSKQAFAILPKVREADMLMTPALQDRVVEVHPEVSFWALNGRRTLEFWKRKPQGAQERLRILASAFADSIAELPAPKGSGLDDLYDACAAAWTAGRIAYGTEERLPPDPDLDSTGLRMEIVY